MKQRSGQGSRGRASGWKELGPRGLERGEIVSVGRQVEFYVDRRLEVFFGSSDGQVVRADERSGDLVAREEVDLRVERYALRLGHVDGIEQDERQLQGFPAGSLLIDTEYGVRLVTCGPPGI